MFNPSAYLATILDRTYLPCEGGPTILEYPGSSVEEAHSALMDNLPYVIRSYAHNCGSLVLESYLLTKTNILMEIVDSLKKEGLSEYVFDGTIISLNPSQSVHEMASSLSGYLLKHSPWFLVESSPFLHAPFKPYLLEIAKTRRVTFEIEFSFDFEKGIERMALDHPKLHKTLSSLNDFNSSFEGFLYDDILKSGSHPFFLDVDLLMNVHQKIAN